METVSVNQSKDTNSLLIASYCQFLVDLFYYKFFSKLFDTSIGDLSVCFPSFDQCVKVQPEMISFKDFFCQILGTDQLRFCDTAL